MSKDTILDDALRIAPDLLDLLQDVAGVASLSTGRAHSGRSLLAQAYAAQAMMDGLDLEAALKRLAHQWAVLERLDAMGEAATKAEPTGGFMGKN